MDRNWPFDQPPNCAVFTSRQIMYDGRDVTHVYHDEEDHGWQFHDATAPTTKDTMLVCLSEVLGIDDSLFEVADLPPGWVAVRTAKGAPWIRQIQHADTTRVEVDWATIRNPTVFFDLLSDQCDFPSWHGKNLDALADSWVTGGISPKGPPYVFSFSNGDAVPPELISFRDAVQRIARESVYENDGLLFVDGIPEPANPFDPH